MFAHGYERLQIVYCSLSAPDEVGIWIRIMVINTQKVGKRWRCILRQREREREKGKREGKAETNQVHKGMSISTIKLGRGVVYNWHPCTFATILFCTPNFRLWTSTPHILGQASMIILCILYSIKGHSAFCLIGQVEGSRCYLTWVIIYWLTHLEVKDTKWVFFFVKL